MLDTFHGGPPYPVVRRKRRPHVEPQPERQHEPQPEPTKQDEPKEPAAPPPAPDGGEAGQPVERSADAAPDGNRGGQPPVLEPPSAAPEPAAAGIVKDLPEETDDGADIVQPPAVETKKGTPHGVDVQSGRRNRTGRQQ